MTVKPLVGAFFAWIKEVQSSNHLPKVETLESINYCKNQEEAQKVFLNDGEIPLDNNAAGRALRSFCLHKHTWKLNDSIDSAKSNAITYSMAETAKANHLNPFRYLTYVLTVLKDHQYDTERRSKNEPTPRFYRIRIIWRFQRLQIIYNGYLGDTSSH